MLDIETLQKIDVQKMYEVYDKWPELAKSAYESNIEKIDFKDIDHVIFAGMGGSGSIGDVFASSLSKTSLHVTVVKGYSLPNTADSNTLVVTTSVSGNTTETISVLNSAKAHNSKIIAFSSGGEIEKYCQKNLIP